MDKQVEAVGWAIVHALHANVPEDKRPMAWSDLDQDQEARIRAAAVDAIETYRNDFWWPNRDEAHPPIYPALRRNRAEALTAHVMSIVGKYLCDHGDARGHRNASRDLLEAFYESGAEVITDADRVRAGLPERGPYGLTAYELQVMEDKRMEIMLRPIPPLEMNDHEG